MHVARLNTPQSYVGSAAIDGPIIALGRPYAASPQAFKGAASVFTSDLDRDGLLDAWEIARFGTTAGHSALDDSDRDGRVELLEQAFDTDPTRSDATAAPRVVNEDGYLMLTLTKRAGVAYLGQSAATLDAPGFSTGTTEVLVNNATTLKVRDTVPVGAAPQRFLRVQVSAAP